MELEPSSGIPVTPPADACPRMAEPLPVRLVAVEDVTLISAAGQERQLDEFYVGLLKFERDQSDLHRLSYHAENVDLHFRVLEPLIERQELRAQGIEVPSLRDLELQLLDRNLPYTWQRGIAPGARSIVLQDPAGNWLEIREARLV